MVHAHTSTESRALGPKSTRTLICLPPAPAAAIEPPPRPITATPARSGGTRPTLENAFRRWMNPDLRPPMGAGEPAQPLSYDVYTPEQLAASVRAGAARKRQPGYVPVAESAASIALHVGLLFVAVCVALGTVLAVFAVSGDDPSSPKVPASEQLIATSLHAVPPVADVPVNPPPPKSLVGVSSLIDLSLPIPGLIGVGAPPPAARLAAPPATHRAKAPSKASEPRKGPSARR